MKLMFTSLASSYKNVWMVSKAILIIILSKAILGLSPLFSIWFFEKLFDSILLSVENNIFTWEILLFLFGLATTILFTFAFNKFIDIVRNILTYKFESEMKGKLYDISKKIPFIQFEDPKFQNRFIGAVTGQKNMLGIIDASTSILQSFIALFSVTIYLINISPYFSLLLFIMILPLIYIELEYGKQRFLLSKKLVEQGRRESYYEGLLLKRETLKEIRINNLEDVFINKWKKSYINNSKEKVKLVIRQTKWLILSNLILFISFIGSGTYVYYLMVHGILSIGSLAAVLQAIQRVQGIVPGLTSSISNFYELSLHVNEFLNFSFQSQEEKRVLLTPKEIKSIETKNLTFVYPDRSHPTLENINLKITKNSKIAIIGGNGAGKTTLIKCLTGLYDTANMIKINGDIDLTQVNLRKYWSKISVLFQDFNKYELTVKENIVVNGELDQINMDKIVQYMEQTGMHKYIERLPSKYETILGRLFKGGNELSGGQWQKLAIARALIKEGDIIFLDEPTSSLDPESELFIIKNLLNSLKETGIVYITHRINVAMLADQIILLENGKIIEKGSHEELLKRKGKYYNLYCEQLNQLQKVREG
jgi:ATP-binding cassette, subfamily B, bacterial